MRRLVVVALVALLAGGLSACSGNAAGSQAGGVQGQGTAAPTGDPTSSPQDAASQGQTQNEVAAPAYAADYSDTLIVGDSVLHLIEGALYETMPAATINAASGRSLEEGGRVENYDAAFGYLDILRADGGNGYARYVIGPASNEPEGMSYEAGEEIVSILQGKPVWFITQMVTNNQTSTENTNATIDALCANHPNVRKIDWHQVCVDNPGFLSDNAHATSEGAAVLARLIADELNR